MRFVQNERKVCLLDKMCIIFNKEERMLKIKNLNNLFLIKPYSIMLLLNKKKAVSNF